MTRIVVSDEVARFVGERCNTIIYPPFTAMGIERGGEIVAGVVFNCFTHYDVHVTVAGRGFTRAFLRGVGNYVFYQLGCLRMSVTTEQERVIDYAKRLGAQTEGRKRNHFGRGRHAIVLGILKEDWKF
nr:GNAT family protein [uncultured Bradyrhizobium sp.]